MSFNPAPTELFPGLTSDGTNLTIPIADIPELDSMEADPVTGDVRKFIYALAKQFSSWWYGTLAADRPSRVTVSENISVNVAAGTQTVSITIRCTTDIPSTDIIPE